VKMIHDMILSAHDSVLSLRLSLLPEGSRFHWW
jgi:hypothetical protein